MKVLWSKLFHFIPSRSSFFWTFNLLDGNKILEGTYSVCTISKFIHVSKKICWTSCNNKSYLLTQLEKKQKQNKLKQLWYSPCLEKTQQILKEKVAICGHQCDSSWRPHPTCRKIILYGQVDICCQIKQMVDLFKPPLPCANLLKKLLTWYLVWPLGSQHNLVIIFSYLIQKCWVLDACDLFPLNKYLTVTSKSRGFFLFCETLNVPVSASPSQIVITSSRYITVCFQCVGLDLGPVRAMVRTFQLFKRNTRELVDCPCK